MPEVGITRVVSIPTVVVFPAPFGPEEPEDLALGHLEVEVVDRLDAVSVDLGERPRADHHAVGRRDRTPGQRSSAWSPPTPALIRASSRRRSPRRARSARRSPPRRARPPSSVMGPTQAGRSSACSHPTPSRILRNVKERRSPARRRPMPVSRPAANARSPRPAATSAGGLTGGQAEHRVEAKTVAVPASSTANAQVHHQTSSSRCSTSTMSRASTIAITPEIAEPGVVAERRLTRPSRASIRAPAGAPRRDRPEGGLHLQETSQELHGRPSPQLGRGFGRLGRIREPRKHPRDTRGARFRRPDPVLAKDIRHAARTQGRRDRARLRRAAAPVPTTWPTKSPTSARSSPPGCTATSPASRRRSRSPRGRAR